MIDSQTGFARPKVTVDELCDGKVQISIRHRTGKQREFLIRNVTDARGTTRFADADVGGRWEYMGTFHPGAIHPEEALKVTSGSKFQESDLAVHTFRRFIIQLLYFGEVRENEFHSVVRKVG